MNTQQDILSARSLPSLRGQVYASAAEGEQSTVWDELDEWLDDFSEALHDLTDGMVGSTPDLDPWEIADTGPPASFSVVGRSPVLGSVQDLLSESAALYKELSGEATVPDSVTSTQGLLDTIMNADPAQLRVMTGQLKGMEHSASVMSSVREFNDDMVERSAESAREIAAFQTQLEADAIAADAADLIDDTNRDLGTNL